MVGRENHYCEFLSFRHSGEMVILARRSVMLKHQTLAT